MQDYIVRGIAAEGQIRAFAVTAKEMVEHARSIHNTSPVATVALGRLLTAGAMMGTMMKGERDLMTIQIKSDGPIGGLTVTSDSKANVKGYVKHPDIMLPLDKNGHLDVAKALGIGVLSVIKDIGMKEPYVGDTILVTSEIADDLTYYFATSEQVPSSVGLGVLMSRENTVEQAGGFIIQLLPGASEDIINQLEKKIQEIKSVTAMLGEGNTPEEILNGILGDFDFKILDKVPAQFACNCSRERVTKALISIGKGEMEMLISENKPVEMNCHFCNTNYVFPIEELTELIDEM